MAELLGQHRYQLDQKGRIALPLRFRAAFADGAYVTLGQDDCLYVFSPEEFRRQAERVRFDPSGGQASRDYSRMFFAHAGEARLDSQGRLTIPQYLRSQIRLEREAVVVGMYDHLQIWEAGTWDRYERERVGVYAGGALDVGRGEGARHEG